MIAQFVDCPDQFALAWQRRMALVLIVWLALQAFPSAFLGEMPAIIIGPDGPSYTNQDRPMPFEGLSAMPNRAMHLEILLDRSRYRQELAFLS